MKPILLAGASLAAVLALTLSGCDAVQSKGYPRDSAVTSGDGQMTPSGPPVPPGFKDSDGDGLAVKAVDHLDSACDISLGTCFQVLVYSAGDCDVYMAINGLDASGAIVDSANDTATMRAGDTARLTLQFTEFVDHLQPTALECN